MNITDCAVLTTLSYSCVRGVLHEGEPQGSFETVAGIRTYVSKPAGTFEETKAIVYLGGCSLILPAELQHPLIPLVSPQGDIFGFYPNSQVR